MKNLQGSPIPLFKLKVQEKGKIRDIKDIIVRVQGLPTCLNGQVVDFGDGIHGMIMGFDEEDVLVLVLGDAKKLKMGKDVIGVSEPFKIPVGESFLGRMVTALGAPCDQRGDVVTDQFLPIFQDSAPITHRGPIDQFLPTGTKIIDMLIPIAVGQRELILGDRMTGKTVVAVDAMLSQKGRDVICIYCAIGKSVSALEKVMSSLHDHEALDHTIVMVATDSAPVGEQYLVPFCAASMGGYFAGRGRDVLVVFDDLTKHAWAYRQLSLLLERPPGREAYPGDIFYVQTQLMERAGKFNEKNGGGSMTFLGIAETQQGDLTGYIPSNLASMCDGQIYMSSTIFAEGFRPAIDLMLSLSIIGGRAHPPIFKKLSRPLRADYAKYNEVLKLSKLQSGLSGEAERTVKRGEAIRSVFQQGQASPSPLVEQVLLLFALHKDILTRLPDSERVRFREGILAFARENHPELLEKIANVMDLTPELEREMEEVISRFFAQGA